eukprot:585439-Prymnesium_polylepis.2
MAAGSHGHHLGPSWGRMNMRSRGGRMVTRGRVVGHTSKATQKMTSEAMFERSTKPAKYGTVSNQEQCQI